MMLFLSHLAITNSSRTIRDPSPINFCTNSDPDTRMKVHSVWWATALASKVLPETINGLVKIFSNFRYSEFKLKWGEEVSDTSSSPNIIFNM